MSDKTVLLDKAELNNQAGEAGPLSNYVPNKKEFADLDLNAKKDVPFNKVLPDLKIDGMENESKKNAEEKCFSAGKGCFDPGIKKPYVEDGGLKDPIKKPPAADGEIKDPIKKPHYDGGVKDPVKNFEGDVKDQIKKPFSEENGLKDVIKKPHWDKDLNGTDKESWQKGSQLNKQYEEPDKFSFEKR